MLSWVLFFLILIIAGYAFVLKRKAGVLLNNENNKTKILRSAFDSSSTGLAVAKPGNRYFEINKAYGEILGYPVEELYVISHKELIHPDDREIDDAYVEEIYEGKRDFLHARKRYIHKKGHIIWLETAVSAIRDEDGELKYLVTQIQDITQAKEAEQELILARKQAERLAYTDYLTDCLNRRAFLLRLEEELERAKRCHNQTSLILVDIDLFKGVNDQYGHIAGDYVLQRFSECLRQNVRPYDFIGRYGGEEFIICLSESTLDNAAAVAERMRKCIEELEVGFMDTKIKITGSFGVACYKPDSVESIEQLIFKADQAMYTAKSRKNTVFQWAS